MLASKIVDDKLMRWNTLAKIIGRNMKRLRLAKGLTQEKAAERSLALSVRHWQYLEKGEVNATLDSLTKVARALAVTPEELMKP